MGTVPRQESVPNSSMRHRELLKWHCWFALFSARARARRAFYTEIRFSTPTLSALLGLAGQICLS
jgi:hypothetical protein